MKSQTQSKTLIGAAVTAAARAQTGTIAIEGAIGGILTSVEVIAYPTLETVVNSGGLVEFENDSVVKSWKPFEVYTDGVTVVDAGGASQQPRLVRCTKTLPSDSNVTVWYTPQDDQSQKLGVCLTWERTSKTPAKETYMKSGVGTAITQVTVAASHVTIKCPAHKGGTLKAVEVQIWGTEETVVNSGGLIVLLNETDNWSPFEILTGFNTCVTEGGGLIKTYRKPCNKQFSGNVTAKINYTPQDNQSQLATVTLIWER